MRRTDYWDRVLDACNDRRDDLGAFPPPVLTTIGAAEIVKVLLQTADPGGGPYGGTMACSVVQLHDLVSGQQTFVVAFSGYHPTLRLDLGRGAAELKDAFEGLGKSVTPAPRFWYRTAAPNYYVPLHQQTQEYFKRNLLVPKPDSDTGEMEGVDVTKRAVKFEDIQPYLDFNVWKTKVFEGRKRILTDITTTTTDRVIEGKGSAPPKTIQITTNTPQFGDETGDFSYAYRGKADRKKVADMAKKKGDHIGTAMYTPGESFAQLKGAIQAFLCGMLSSFLALRMDLIQQTDVPAAVKSARALIRQLKAIGDSKWRALATYLEQVLISPRLTASQLDMEVTAGLARERRGNDLSPLPDPEDSRLSKKERGVLKKEWGKRHWKDVPTHARVTTSELQIGLRNLKKPTTGELVSARKELVEELQNDELLGDLLPQIWAASGGGPNGQFCAEPKAFDDVRNGNLIERGIDQGKSRAVIVGQLAVWYSGGDQPRPFSEQLLIIGPEGDETKSKSGGYMLPCSSCSARSAVMMEGVTSFNPDVEAPTLFTKWDVQMRDRCVICGEITRLQCGRCFAVSYCKKEHQQRDWKRHKTFCAPNRR
ncbi:zinc finger MYND domain-containing protein [Sorangium sp. So ce726]|uniref:zinc finger MYND domain-containing protein n=1 Tax=Sorangium sp. So ce726 TaxID=3133319 RepID=UPI003F602296